MAITMMTTISSSFSLARNCTRKHVSSDADLNIYFWVLQFSRFLHLFSHPAPRIRSTKSCHTFDRPTEESYNPVVPYPIPDILRGSFYLYFLQCWIAYSSWNVSTIKAQTGDCWYFHRSLSVCGKRIAIVWRYLGLHCGLICSRSD